MLGKVKKHLNKILVFALNLSLMGIVLLVIKERDQEKRSLETQNDLSDTNSSLSDENSVLKDELQSLQGVIQEIESIPANVEKKVEAPSSANTQAQNPASNISSPPIAPPASAKTPSTKSIPASNSQTKTS
jgi:hypothetical protein